VSQASTTAAVSSSSNPSDAGDPVTFTAEVAPVPPGAGTPTGNLTFSVDGADQAVALSGGNATLQTSSLSVGTHQITANYWGDAKFAPSTTASTFTQTVNPQPTSTSLSSDTNPSNAGQEVKFNATITGAPNRGVPTGTVEFVDNGALLFAVVLGANGTAEFDTSDLGIGTQRMTAVYGGSAISASSISNELDQVVSSPDSPTPP
jgi:polyisoprenoid-binding protein YceI